MSKEINITKTIQTITEWKNTETNEKIQLDGDTIYLFNDDNLLEASFDIKTVPFLSMVLDQIIHKFNTIHNDDTHN